MGVPETGSLPDPGATEWTNMAWVVRFLRVKVPTLTLPQLRDVLFHVRTIARLALSDRNRPFARWQVVADETPQRDIRSDGQVFVEARLRDTLTDYQTSLKRTVNELCHQQRTVVYLSPGQLFGSFPFEIVAGRSHPALFVNEGTINEVLLAFDFRLTFILQACADRLRVCKRTKCSQVFLQTHRADREYCSRHCGSLVRVQRKREKDKQAKQQQKTRTKQHTKGARYGTKTRTR